MRYLPALVVGASLGVIAGIGGYTFVYAKGASYLTNDPAACANCHGVPGVDKGGNIRNLGYVPKDTIENLQKIVFKGPFREQGMPDFTGKLTEADVVKIQLGL